MEKNIKNIIRPIISKVLFFLDNKNIRVYN